MISERAKQRQSKEGETQQEKYVQYLTEPYLSVTLWKRVTGNWEDSVQVVD